jgi:ketosteroid isomerase-like protein
MDNATRPDAVAAITDQPTETKTAMSLIDTAKQYIRAVQTGDQATLAKIISPAVIWHQPGNNRFSGKRTGIADVVTMLGQMMEVSRGSFTLSRADQFMENGEWVAITIEFTADRPGAKLAQPGVDLLRIENGQIVEVRLFSSDQAAEDTFWGR